MGSRHISLEMGDVADTTLLLAAFEQQNNVRLELRLSVEYRGVRPTLLIVALAHRWDVEIGEVPPLASASVKCSDMNLKALGAALTHAMYVLDSQLAEAEWERIKNLPM